MAATSVEISYFRQNLRKKRIAILNHGGHGENTIRFFDFAVFAVLHCFFNFVSVLFRNCVAYPSVFRLSDR